MSVNWPRRADRGRRRPWACSGAGGECRRASWPKPLGGRFPERCSYPYPYPYPDPYPYPYPYPNPYPYPYPYP
jgi:hypothetical protein